MKTNHFFLLAVLALSSLQVVSAAHWLVGYVEDAMDGTSPNGRIVQIWNDAKNTNRVNGTVGPTGLSSTSNVFLIDCELLNVSCVVGDEINATLWDDGSGYNAKSIVKVTVTGAGFDVMPNITMNSPPNVSNVLVDDAYTAIPNEIDLTPASNTTVTCTGIVEEFEGLSSLSLVSAQFYVSTSFFGDGDDNNDHYTNNSCVRDDTYGTQNQTEVNCTFAIEYYANSGTWTCTINATDTTLASSNASDTTTVNTLLAIGVNNTIDFGTVNVSELTPERNIEVINYGNTPTNLSLSGFGNVSEDGNSMNCLGKNITVAHTKYNLTSSNSSEMTLSESESYYENLTAAPAIKEFNLNSRQDDVTNDAINNTYWRVYVPEGIGPTCQGNIVVGATQG